MSSSFILPFLQRKSVYREFGEKGFVKLKKEPLTEKIRARL